MPITMFDTVLINGSVGTGKTTTAEVLGDEVGQRGIPGAVIDVDGLRRSWPSPAGDPFRTALALKNLEAVTTNFRRAGAELIMVASVVETIDELERTAVALATRRMLHVRLTASPDAILSRLTRRHNNNDAALHWHTQRHPELTAVLDQAGFTNSLRIDTTDKPAASVANEILTAIVE